MSYLSLAMKFGRIYRSNMRIGELAEQTHCQVETIRYYEQQGLLPITARSEGNYRIYGDEHAERLRFIMHCRSLDMELDEIRALLKLKDAPAESCAEVNELLDAHIGHVATRIRELRQLERQLRDLRAQCQSAQSTADCGILSQLSTTSTTKKSNRSALEHVHRTHKKER